jgi:hypothetical protein
MMVFGMSFLRRCAGGSARGIYIIGNDRIVADDFRIASGAPDLVAD